MDDSVADVLRRLIDRTAAGRAQWVVFPDEEMIRTDDMLDGLPNLVRLRKGNEADETPADRPDYTVYRTDYYGRLAEQHTVRPDDPEYPLAVEAYRSGRAIARDLNAVWDEQLRALRAERVGR